MHRLDFHNGKYRLGSLDDVCQRNEARAVEGMMGKWTHYCNSGYSGFCSACKIEELETERDEARKAAREMLLCVNGHQSGRVTQNYFRERYPWLEEYL